MCLSCTARFFYLTNPMNSVTNMFPSLHWLQEAYRPRYHYLPCNSCIHLFPESILFFWIVSSFVLFTFIFHLFYSAAFFCMCISLLEYCC